MAKEVKKTKKKKTEDDLDITTRIRTDGDRLNEAESLDVSFIDKSNKKNISKEQKKALKEKKDYSLVINIFKVLFYIVLIGCLLVGGYYFVKKSNLFEIKKSKVTKTIEKVEDNKVLMDDNYLFVGDMHTYDMEFDEFYKPYVKISNNDYTTSDILDDLKDYIYVYNPSVVFIELGINDFKGETSINEVVSNIESIIKGIKNNRSKAIIYVESLYPINDSIEGFVNPIGESINNDLIRDVNSEIERVCKSLNVNYLNVYSELSENDLLKDNYTDDGFNLNEEGYKKLFKIINRVVD